MNTRSVITAVVVATLMSIVSTAPAAQGKWTRKADIPTARCNLSTSVLDGKIYAFGGRTGSWPSTAATSSVVEVYDPATNRWARKANMPGPREGLSTCVVDGKIYAIGGMPRPGLNQPALVTVEVYDPATDTWTRKADIPRARCDFSASVVNGKIYVIGGVSGRGLNRPALATVEVYDPATDTWTRKHDMPEATCWHSASAVDGKIYVIGGGARWSGTQPIQVSLVWEYYPATDAWTPRGDMPTDRGAHSASVVNGRIYTVGGASDIGNITFATVEAYDPATDTWTTEANMSTSRGLLATSAVGGKIYAIGGTRDPLYSWTPVATVEEYDTGLTIPPPDFNGDEIVDFKDFSILVQYWLQEEPSVDIAPPPFGDHIVDFQDLAALSEYWLKEVMPVGLVARWNLDETEGKIAYDSVSNKDATLNGNPIWQPEGGKVAGALQFDGVDDYVSTPFILDPAAGSFSVFAWIKGGAPGQVIISQTDGTGTRWLWTDPSYGRLISWLMHPPFDPLMSGSTITDGQWHHVGLVYDFDGLRRYLYVDGAQAAKDINAVGGVGSDGGLYFGADKTLDAGSFFSGLIDNVRIYDRAVTP